MDWGVRGDTVCVISVISRRPSPANDANCKRGFRGKALGWAGGQERQLALLNLSYGHGSGHFATPGPSSPPQDDNRELCIPR